MLERLSDASRAAVDLAAKEATRLGHHHLGTEHLLVGLLLEGRSRAALALKAAGVTVDGARDKVVEALGGRSAAVAEGERVLTPRAQRALERANRFSLQARLAHVEPEQVLLGVLDVEGTASQVLRGLGVDVVALSQALAPDATGPHVAGPGAGDASGSPAVRPPLPDVDEPAARSGPQAGGEEAPAPHCPVCGAGLEGGLGWKKLAAGGTGGASRDFVVAYCSACGSALGAAPPAPPAPRARR